MLQMAHEREGTYASASLSRRTTLSRNTNLTRSTIGALITGFTGWSRGASTGRLRRVFARLALKERQVCMVKRGGHTLGLQGVQLVQAVLHYSKDSECKNRTLQR